MLARTSSLRCGRRRRNAPLNGTIRGSAGAPQATARRSAQSPAQETTAPARDDPSAWWTSTPSPPASSRAPSHPVTTDPPAGDAESGLQAPGPVVDPGVDDAAGASGLVGGDPRLALEHRDPHAVVAEPELAGDGQSGDPCADDHHVALAGGAGDGRRLWHRASLPIRSVRGTAPQAPGQTPARALAQA